MTEISPAIRATMTYVQLQEFVADLQNMIDEEIESRPGHEPRLGRIATKTRALGGKIKHYRDLLDPPIEGQEHL